MGTGELSTAERTLNWARANGFLTWFEPETTSTNAVAKDLTAPMRASQTTKSTKPLIFLTERQTAGRGRGDHTWSTPHDALLSSWSYSLEFVPQPILSALVGLALFEACTRAFTDVPFNLKAPNDLYIGDKKVAGLLIETLMSGPDIVCVVGLGLNAGSGAADIATSIGLSDVYPADLIQDRWPLFLKSWIDGVDEALSAARKSELGAGARERLKQALNLHPLLKESVVNVGPMGQIEFTSHTLNWNDL